MSLLRQTLLHLVICGFLVALCTSLFSEQRLRRLVRFAGGCFLAAVVLIPLIHSDLASFLEGLRPELPAQSGSDAQEKNDRLLRELIEAQTAEYIETAARQLGAELRAEVETERDDASGLFVPVQVTLRGFVTAQQQQALSAQIEQELAIAPQRQRWVNG